MIFIPFSSTMEFEKHKKLLNDELDHFTMMLAEILPRYLELVRKTDVGDEELKELGEIEHFLIDVNAKIAEIKTKLDHDLFGEALDEYYKVKNKALAGDPSAKKKLVKLRASFSESIKGDLFFNWN